MKTILVVDGNEEVRQSMSRLLRQEYPETRVIAVPNGQEAVFLALYEELGVILMGADMPIMNGYEAAHKLRHMPRTSQIPLVALTKEQDSTSIASGLRRLCDAFLAPSPSGTQIRNMVATFAAQPSA